VRENKAANNQTARERNVNAASARNRVASKAANRVAASKLDDKTW
jgi:hypothetical protein